MRVIEANDIAIHTQLDGMEDASAPTVVFANSLGTDLHLWDKIIPLLPEGLRLIRYDKRGHGKTSVPAAPYKMGQLVSDAEAVCDAYNARDVLFVGLSIGGMIAQGLAAKRLDIVRTVVLSNTGAKIGTREMWADRIATVNASGMDVVADGTMGRWFSKSYVASGAHLPWRERFTSTDPAGYAGCCAAIQGTDFYTPTASLRLPALGIAGSEDGATPPDLVRETVGLIPGSAFHLIRGAGHLPCVEKPEEYATALNDFMKKTGHI